MSIRSSATSSWLSSVEPVVSLSTNVSGFRSAAPSAEPPNSDDEAEDDNGSPEPLQVFSQEVEEEVEEECVDNVEAAIKRAPKTNELVFTSQTLEECVDEMIEKHDPLHEYAALGEADKVEELVRNGASVMLRDGIGRTAMHHAAHLGHEHVVQRLHSLGAKVDAKDTIGQQPLHHAASGSKHTLNVLVELKASPVAEDKDGRTPLHIVAQLGRVNECGILIALKADADRSTACETPLRMAIRAGQVACVEKLVQCKADINSKEAETNETPLHVAAISYMLPCLETVIAMRANMDQRDSHNLTPLHVAVHSNCFSAVEVLVAKGAKLHIGGGSRNQTPLHMAVAFDAVETIDVLLRLKADINAKDNQGFTPLHTATQRASAQALEMLLENDADLDAVTKAGDTALHLAVRTADMGEIAQQLIDADIDVNACVSGWSPLHLAADLDNLEIAVILAQNGVDVDLCTTQTPLHIACWRGHSEICDLLAECQAAPSMHDQHGETPLMLAVRKNHPECVKALLRLDAEMVRYRELLPIQHAIISDAFDVFVIFKELGLEPKWEDELPWHRMLELATFYRISEPFLNYIKQHGEGKFVGTSKIKEGDWGADTDEEEDWGIDSD